jgi:hypothetical protein
VAPQSSRPYGSCNIPDDRSGVVISLFAASDLENGIAAERWSQSEIDTVRNFFMSRWTMVITIGIFIVGLIVSVLFLFRVWNHPNHLGFAFLFMGQTFVGLLRAVKQPLLASPKPRLNSSAPLQSQHWGGR